MKLFQIEEPDGAPADPDAPGAAIGIDVGGAQAEVAVAVGGNAMMLQDREGFERALPVPEAGGSCGVAGSVRGGAAARRARAWPAR